jgi:hypothetical protein
MAPVDAQFYWMSAKIPNDEFLLFAFDGVPADSSLAMEHVRQRGRACPDFTTRIRDDNRLTYPRWVPSPVVPEQVIRHDLADDSWDGCLAAVMDLADSQLDIRRITWRVHVFTPVQGIPGVTGPGSVAVVQIPHAVADGTRTSAMAAWLLGRADRAPEVHRRGAGFPPLRAAEAIRTHRQLERDIRDGLLAPGLGTRPLLQTNARPAGPRLFRTLVRHRSQLRGPTITVGVLTALSAAISNLLGGEYDSLGAEVPMAKSGVREANNHFGSVTVGLYPKLDSSDRAERIAADLANGRRRLEHPASRAADRAFAAVPAALLRWGVSKFDPDVRPAQVAGNTVISSVNRGAADLTFGGARVVLTTGYPVLSPLMGLTHGVHGIGETVAISVHATQSAFGNKGADIDDYVRLLDSAL